MSARTIDDLVLSPDGEQAREEARLAILDGRPLDDVLVLPDPEPEPEPIPEYVLARRERHFRAMDRAFPGRRPYAASSLRGRTLGTYPEWIVDLLHDENEAVPDRCLPFLPEPEVRDGMIWGASVTTKPRARIDAECAFEAREVEPDLPTSPAATDVSAWLEGLYEPMSATDLADLTGYSYHAVRTALVALHEAGLVARQEINGTSALWVWRRAAL